MPIPLADRIGRLNTPRVQPGRAPSTAEAEANIGRIGQNTMRMMQQAGNDMARAVTYMQRQKESMAAQDALTEYLAGRQKLDTVRNAMALENAVDFEDKYYKEAEKLHTEFVNKINRLQYSDIRERARGQANDTNITEAAQAENFFFRQKEAVSDVHTDALIETKRRDVVNNVNSNPGMDNYNKGNIAEGYQFVLDTRKNRLLEKGYRDGTPEMDIAMSKEKDDFFASVLEELSHRPDDGLRLAHSMGKAFKDEMTPEQWNESMRPISADNLSEELLKDPTRFFKNGDVLTGNINMKAAAVHSAALNDRERRRMLESFQDEVRKGSTTTGAANKTLFSTKYMQKQAMWMQSSLGTFAGIIKDNNDISGISTADREKISKHLQQNVDITDLVNKLFEWENNATLLTDTDAKRLLELKTNFITLLGSDPELGTKSLRETWFRGKKPSVSDVAYAIVITQHINTHREKTWRDNIPFGFAGKSPMGNLGLEGLDDALRAANLTVSNGKYVNVEFDSMKATDRNNFFKELANNINECAGAEYALRFGDTDAIGSLMRQRREGILGAVLDSIEDFIREPNVWRKSYSDYIIPGGRIGGAALRTVNAMTLSTLYYGGRKANRYLRNVWQNVTDMPDEVPLSVKSTNKLGQFKTTYMSAAGVNVDAAEQVSMYADTGTIIYDPKATYLKEADYKKERANRLYADRINYYNKLNKKKREEFING